MRMEIDPGRIIAHGIHDVRSLELLRKLGIRMAECDVAFFDFAPLNSKTDRDVTACDLTTLGVVCPQLWRDVTACDLTALLVGHPQLWKEMGYCEDSRGFFRCPGYWDIVDRCTSNGKPQPLYLHDFVKQAREVGITLFIEVKPLPTKLPDYFLEQLLFVADAYRHVIISFDANLLARIRSKSHVLGKDPKLGFLLGSDPLIPHLHDYLTIGTTFLWQQWRTSAYVAAATAAIAEQQGLAITQGGFLVNTPRELERAVSDWDPTTLIITDNWREFVCG